MAARGQPEALQRFGIELEDDRLGLRDETHLHGEFEIGAVGHLVVALVSGKVVMPEAAIVDIALQLVRIGLALADRGAVLAAPAGERADAGCALMSMPAVVCGVPSCQDSGMSAELAAGLSGLAFHNSVAARARSSCSGRSALAISSRLAAASLSPVLATRANHL